MAKQSPTKAEYWYRLSTPPRVALKPIMAGRLKGKNDINPVWRLKVMSDVFGTVGVGWKYELHDPVFRTGPDNQEAVFVRCDLYIKDGEEWSAPITGWGGNMFVEKERNGLHLNDEAIKMAATDALGTAMKSLGVAADVYQGIFDTKYSSGGGGGASRSNSVSCPKCKSQMWANLDQAKKNFRCRDCGTIVYELLRDGSNNPDFDNMYKQYKED